MTLFLGADGGEDGGYGSLRTADAFSVVVSLPLNFRRRRSDNWKCVVVRRLGLWVISEKNILQTDFKGKIILQGTIWEKNFSDEKKNLSWHIMLVRKILHRCMLGKKILSPEVWERKILTQTKSP